MVQESRSRKTVWSEGHGLLVNHQGQGRTPEGLSRSLSELYYWHYKFSPKFAGKGSIVSSPSSVVLATLMLVSLN